MSLDLHTAEFLLELARTGALPPERLGVTAARNAMAEEQAVDRSSAAVDIEDLDVSVGAGTVGIRIIRPSVRRSIELPCVIYLHGGGWVLGDERTHDRLVRDIAVRADVALVFVKYSRAPEKRYPVALEETLGVLQWLGTEGPDRHIDPERIALAGDSAGGNLAAALALKVQERSGPSILFLALVFPVVDADFETASYREFATGHFLSRETMQWFWQQYLPDLAVRRQPAASPLRASLEQLRHMPPTLIVTAQNDVLRDEGEAFAARLMEAGCDVVATRYLGTIHASTVLAPLSRTPAARAIVDQLCHHLSMRLHQQRTSLTRPG